MFDETETLKQGTHRFLKRYMDISRLENDLKRNSNKTQEVHFQEQECKNNQNRGTIEESRQNHPRMAIVHGQLVSIINPIHFMAIWAYQVATVGGRK